MTKGCVLEGTLSGAALKDSNGIFQAYAVKCDLRGLKIDQKKFRTQLRGLLFSEALVDRDLFDRKSTRLLSDAEVKAAQKALNATARRVLFGDRRKLERLLESTQLLRRLESRLIETPDTGPTEITHWASGAGGALPLSFSVPQDASKPAELNEVSDTHSRERPKIEEADLLIHQLAFARYLELLRRKARKEAEQALAPVRVVMSEDDISSS